MSSVNNNIPFVPENTIDPAAGLNLSINIIDAIMQIAVVSVGANTPPGSPATGARYIVGTSPTGAWAGQANKLARWLDSVWSFFDARYAVNLTDSQLYIRGASGWASVSGGSGMTNPMTTAGDIIVGGTSGSPARLAIGSEGQVPVVRSGALVYEDQAGGTVPYAPVVTESTTARTLSLADAGDYIRFTNASASTCTVPPQSSEAWAAYTEIHVRRTGAGNLTLTPGSGVTLNAPSGGTLVLTAGMSVTLKRSAENVWDVIGQTVAA